MGILLQLWHEALFGANVSILGGRLWLFRCIIYLFTGTYSLCRVDVPIVLSPLFSSQNFLRESGHSVLSAHKNIPRPPPRPQPWL